MDRSDSNRIAALMRGPRGLKSRRVKLEAGPERRAPKVRHCKCGICPDCIDNARWERIFAAKFADPHYYTRTNLSQGSPLSRI